MPLFEVAMMAYKAKLAIFKMPAPESNMIYVVLCQFLHASLYYPDNSKVCHIYVT